MALDFPSGPSVNDTYTYNGKTWRWTGTTWLAVNAGVQGIQGIQGAQGTQGTQGIQGVQGAIGSDGIQGIQGRQGTQGPQGTQGTQGTQGIQGAIGAGVQGTQGTQGIQGIQGTQGPQGTQGTQGIQGIQGIQGYTGIQGTQGITGAGVQGAQGTQGTQGIQGIQGLKGTKVSATTTPPSSPAANDFWWNSEYGVLMVYYDDGNGAPQWVSAMSGIMGLQGTQGIQGTTGPGTSVDSTNDGSTNSSFYPVFVAGTGAQTPKVSTSKLTFNPSTGDFAAAGNITAYFSDDRLKDRVSNISGALDKVNALNGFYFMPNDVAVSMGYEKRMDVGVSAQEVDEILPEVVVAAPANPKYLTVRYDRMVPLLVEAIKELSAGRDRDLVTIQELQGRVAELERRLN